MQCHDAWWRYCDRERRSVTDIEADAGRVSAILATHNAEVEGSSPSHYHKIRHLPVASLAQSPLWDFCGRARVSLGEEEIQCSGNGACGVRGSSRLADRV